MNRELLHARIVGWGFALAFAGAVVWMLGQILPNQFSLSKEYFLILFFVSTVIVTGQGLVHHLAPREVEIPEPKVVRFIPPEHFPNGGFVVKPSKWLSQNLSYAIVLEQEDGYEQLLGVAKYVMMQNNGLIQLITLARASGGAEIWKRLDDGETDQLSKVRVKIGMPADVDE
ncbi:hypothetical protein DSM14862_00272 [Sulfitobacter indolifex]|uniref:Uncharacterized protein n=1 Tax=Sulfitobacter indolifex HEL-45 TaxID=391624 RepID=A0ABM9XAL6_9RHOB|nr:hypothetical protein [Sulfitobacter indolifex]EDQ06530.1 hypothetical protein OIHEL45_06930 [Sulfitobacter indolifex HEL-45]UOA17522.1 hypothetical protein DSM14862_00272 [Sulfitobacter indolifex]